MKIWLSLQLSTLLISTRISNIQIFPDFIPKVWCQLGVPLTSSSLDSLSCSDQFFHRHDNICHWVPTPHLSALLSQKSIPVQRHQTDIIHEPPTIDSFHLLKFHCCLEHTQPFPTCKWWQLLQRCGAAGVKNDWSVLGPGAEFVEFAALACCLPSTAPRFFRGQLNAYDLCWYLSHCSYAFWNSLCPFLNAMISSRQHKAQVGNKWSICTLCSFPRLSSEQLQFWCESPQRLQFTAPEQHRHDENSQVHGTRWDPL